MALITDIIDYPECRKSVKEKHNTELKYHFYKDQEHGPLVVIGANGSKTRDFPNKGSQNMQIKKDIAIRLIKELIKDFNIKSKDLI
jgi:hypothetical protein